MSVTPGNHRIMTSTGKYLTLLTPNGIVTAMPPSGASNQVWNFQPSGNNWIIDNNGYPMNIFAYSVGQPGAPVTGSPFLTEWFVFPFNGVYLIQLGSNISNSWNVDGNNQVNLGPTQLVNPAQQFAIQ